MNEDMPRQQPVAQSQPASNSASIRYANGRVKRAFDLAVGVALSIVTAPIIALLAVGSAVSFRAWPLFVQKRIGRGGRPFCFVKLRTLPTDTPPDEDKYTIAAATTTRWGRFLPRLAPRRVAPVLAGGHGSHESGRPPARDASLGGQVRRRLHGGTPGGAPRYHWPVAGEHGMFGTDRRGARVRPPLPGPRRAEVRRVDLASHCRRAGRPAAIIPRALPRVGLQRLSPR